MKPQLLLLGLGCIASSVSPAFAVPPASVSANDNIAWSKVVENPFDGKIIYDRNNSARQTLRGIEAMNMIRKGQVQGVERGDVRSQVEFVSRIFGLVA